MVRRLSAALVLVGLVAAMGVVAGCVESSEDEAQTPADAPTIANTALQTDAEGRPILPEPVPGPEEVPPAVEANGEVEAGLQFFAATCTSCHLNDGQDAGGVGPRLADQGLEEPEIRDVIENGRGAMPGGLATGDDLDNVTAYVLSLQ
jgi:cytochrome c550